MLLIIIIEHTDLPFILDQASEADCLETVRRAKKMGFEFDENNYTIDTDLIILHAKRTGVKVPKKRYYVLNEKIILVTPADSPEEVQSTKNLLAYKKNVNASMISAVEV